MIFELAVNLVGLASGFVLASKQLLLRRVNRSPHKDGKVARSITSQATEPVENPAPCIKVSVVVLGTNDIGNLSILMTSLSAQTRPVDEIIIVREGEVYPESDLPSSDKIRFIQTTSKSDEWSSSDQQHHGCLAGAAAASGDLILFLTADVHLETDAIRLMLLNVAKYPSDNHPGHFSAMRVQPYCEFMSLFENLSLFTMLAGSFRNELNLNKKNSLIDPLNPVVLISRDVFLAHNSQETGEKVTAETHHSILQLAKAMDVVSQTNSYYLGGQDIRFHPGGGRLYEMMQFLVESTAPRILRMPPRLLVYVALWLVACTSIVIGLIQTALQTDALPVLIYLALYLLALLQLNLASRHVGRYSKSVIFFYPLWLAAFWVIFAISLVRNYIFDRSKSIHKETGP